MKWRWLMSSMRQFHDDQEGIELIEFIVGGTLAIAIMTLAVLAIWNTTHARAEATNGIINTNVPTAAQP
jgi:hypothetical protein